MSALIDLIKTEISMLGPMRLDRYMQLALGHPTLGYYPTRDPLGGAGDFTTAPEISQMFGELLGLWLAQAWLDAGRPTPFILAEAGPGRGTLMTDILRATARVPGFSPEIWLIETSPALRARQYTALIGQRVNWAETLNDLPARPLFFVANEFFDALPIRQARRNGTQWQDILIGLTGQDLTPGLGPDHANPELTARFAAAPDGAIVETCTPAEAFAAQLGQRIAADGGAALCIDYGDWLGWGDTLQALRAHAPTSAFDAPGDADITAHVQFAPLASASGLPGAFTTQGAFLERLGITARAQALAAHGAKDIAPAHRRLTHPAEMGKLFKVLALHAPGKTIAGFDPDEHFAPAI